MNDSLPDVVLLKGAPGVGKSAAAKCLALHCPSGVRIEVDELRRMVIGVKWTDQSEHRAILALGAKLAAGFVRERFAPVILVDTFSGNKLDGFLQAFRSECPQSRVFVAVLHASDDVLRDRILHREEGGFRDLSVSTRLNHEAVRDVRPFEYLIDTTLRSPSQVARAILDAV